MMALSEVSGNFLFYGINRQECFSSFLRKVCNKLACFYLHRFNDIHCLKLCYYYRELTVIVTRGNGNSIVAS